MRLENRANSCWCSLRLVSCAYEATLNWEKSNSTWWCKQRLPRVHAWKSVNAHHRCVQRLGRVAFEPPSLECACRFTFCKLPTVCRNDPASLSITWCGSFMDNFYSIRQAQSHLHLGALSSNIKSLFLRVYGGISLNTCLVL